MAKKGDMLRSIRKGGARLRGPAGDFQARTEGQTPCSIACPAGVDIKAYVNLVADRKYEDAVQVIRRNNPFPGICGRVCTHPCEAECGRADEPVSIKSLKRFASDYELSRKRPVMAAETTRPERVAVVGSGPAGLTAAADLALAGYRVTVFDESKAPGGLLSWGIPDFRLPKNIVRSEIRDIQALGVAIVTGKRIDMPGELLKKGYSAVILATGCQSAILPGIPGQEAAADCLDFLRLVSERGGAELGKRVVVIGGGNAALDSARTALRLGAEVTVAYRRTEGEMPADPEEIAHAREEGVKFEFLAIPIEMKKGSLRFQRAELGEPDSSGRRRPVPVAGDFFDIQADNAIMAIGSRPDPSPFPKAISINASGTPLVDGNCMTAARGIFAAGDVVTGPSTIVDAIGSGHEAAAGVNRYLGGAGIERDGPREMLVVESAHAATADRCGPCFIPMERRISTFEEADAGLDERQAITEAQRCLRCGSCNACDACLAVCDYRNAQVTVRETGESTMAKVPFDVARAALDAPDAWSIELGERIMPVSLEPLLAHVQTDLCIACGKCEEACPYKAIRTVFSPDGSPVARVELTACRGCGACVAACPTGAMVIGHLGDDALLSRIGIAVKRSGENNGIVRFSCMWNRRDTRAGAWPWEVRVQCARRLSPALLLETLAMGARAISVMGCGEEECHYIPGPWMGPDVVDSTRAILEAIDVNPGRVAYIGEPGSGETFMAGIAGLAGFTAIPGEVFRARAGPGRCLDATSVLMAQPDIARKPKADTLLGLGCLGISGPVSEAYALGGDDMLGSAVRLLEMTGVKFDVAWGVHTSGQRLRDLGAEQLYKSYVKSVTRTLNGSRTLVVPTPRSYEAFKGMKLKCKVVSLPEMLANSPEMFRRTGMTVAYHPSCHGGGEFDEHCIKLLGKVPGLNAAVVDCACGQSGWKDADSGAAKQARELLGKAEASGAALLIAGSPECALHLRAATCGWNTSPVKVMDLYTFLASVSGGDA